jgi:hypothetical protein
MSFSKNQDPRVEKLISEALDGIAAAFAASPESSAVRAVVLGGGYGRGEGGATPDGMPYNDLDFFVVMKGSRASAVLRKLLKSISAEWGAKLAIDIDFCCVDSVQALCKDATTLMIQELFAGGNVIFGDHDVFRGVPILPFSEIPWPEGARLLLNRGAGLLFARQRRNDPSQADFIRRNIHKAALGCGDAILVVHHDYRRTGAERLEALRKYHEASWLVPAYRAALDFKFNPGSGPEPSWDFLLDCWLRTVTLVAVEVSGRIASSDALFAAADIARSAPRSLKSLLLSLHSAHQWSGMLSPLAVHPRVKLLRLLTECLLDPSRPDGAFMKLWARYN